MTDSLIALQDEAAIKRVLHHYCRGIDRLDAELVDSVYWDGATDDHGIYKGPGKEFAAFAIPLLREQYESTMHTLGQSLITLHGEQANCETYFVAYHRGRADNRTTLDTVGGRYVDRFEKRDGEWRIAERTVVIEWTTYDDDVRTSPHAEADFVPARRDRNDIAYGG